MGPGGLRADPGRGADTRRAVGEAVLSLRLGQEIGRRSSPAVFSKAMRTCCFLISKTKNCNMPMPFISCFYKQIVLGALMAEMLSYMGETNLAKSCFLVVPTREMSLCVLGKVAHSSLPATLGKVSPPELWGWLAF